MKKSVGILLLLCLAFAATSATAFAQSGNDTGVLIDPIRQDTITVSPAQNLVLSGRWGACTPGLVTVGIAAVNREWTLDDDPILPPEEVAEYFGPIYAVEPEYTCIAGPGTTAWQSDWRYSIGTLPEGTYEISVLVWTDRRLHDGGDYDGDGHIDFFEGTLGEWSVTVHVES